MKTRFITPFAFHRRRGSRKQTVEAKKGHWIVTLRLFTCFPDFLMFSLYGVFSLISVHLGCSLLLYPAYVAYDEHVYRLPGTTAPNRQVFA